MKSLRRYLLLANLGASSLGLAIGCSSTSGQGTADAGGDSASGGHEGGAGGGGGSAGSGGGATQNAVVISQEDDPSVGFVSLFSASFNPHYASASTCTNATSGPCSVSSCKPEAGAITDDNAGTITVSGGKLAGPETVKFGAGGMYTSFEEMKQIFATGDTFKVSGSGGAFPAFSSESAPAPAILTLTGPPSTPGSSGPVYGFDKTQDLTWSWTGGVAGDSAVFNTANLTTGAVISCTFDASKGTGTIPADVVAKLPTGTSALPADMFFYAQSSKTVAAGSQSVSINVTSAGQPIFILGH